MTLEREALLSVYSSNNSGTYVSYIRRELVICKNERDQGCCTDLAVALTYLGNLDKFLLVEPRLEKGKKSAYTPQTAL